MSIPASYKTNDPNSFAYETSRSRWPVILTKAIDDVHKAVNRSSDQEAITEGKKIVEQVAALKYECQHNRALTPIEDDGEDHVTSYNEELAKLEKPSWYNAPWLFLECYLYRRLRTFFCQTKHWKSYDPFSKQKTDTFRSSRSAVLELAARYNSLSTELSKTQSSNPTENESAHRILFHEMCKICLWGNATDLSLLTETSLSDLQKLQGSAAIQAAESNIIVNDIDRAFDVLYSAKTRSTNTTNNSNTSSSERRIDIVLDNAGFELYADLLLAGYLLQSGLATQVVLHPKDIPWFVSDVTPRDFGDLLSLVANAHELYGGDAPSDASGNVSASDRPLASPTTAALSADEKSVLDELAAHWMQVYAEGGIVMRPNPYWTRSNGFWDVKDVAPELYEDLQSSAMVIFKGDLNYRKLTCDLAWPYTTEWQTALGPLGNKSNGLRILALRTCKADVVVGLPEGLDETLKIQNGSAADEQASSWSRTGKYAVVQFSDGKM